MVEHNHPARQLQTPVAFIIFKRPDLTARVFEAIRQAQPQKLYIIADGPRIDRPGESNQCAAARDIVNQVDWDCQVLMNYADTNLGCKQRVATGLDWVFAQEETAIILEDDCLPHLSFFRFCEELLERYRDDQRIMSVSGDNFLTSSKQKQYSYYFSRYTAIWGWATWRRAWQHYDMTIQPWPEFKNNNLLWNIFEDAKAVGYWTQAFQDAYDGNVDTWDFAWTFSCWMQNALCILPNNNLVSNLGFHQDATHTKDTNSRYANVHTQEVNFPLKHPPFVMRDAHADRFIQSAKFSISPVVRLKQQLKRILT